MASHDKARVLVVDDMADVADAMASLLELDGYEVRIASLDNSGRTTLLCTRLRNDGALPREYEGTSTDGHRRASWHKDW